MAAKPFVRRAPRAQRGFVLALTMAVLVAVMIVATYYAESVRIALQTAQTFDAQVRAQEAMFNLRAEALLRMATDIRSPEGLGAGAGLVRLDGRPYKDDAGAILQLRDTRGMLNAAKLPPLWWRTLLHNNGLADATIDAMLDILADYQDADSLRRLNGAEADDYAALGLPPPRNAQLVTPAELRAMPVWRDQKALWDSGFADSLVVTPYLGFNPNTASWQVISAMPGVTPEIAKSIVALRETGRLVGAADFAALGVGGIGGIYSPVSSYPSDTLVLTLWAPGVAWGARSVVMLTPSSLYGPWRILYVERVEKPREAIDPAKITKLPERASGLPESPPSPGLFGPFGG